MINAKQIQSSYNKLYKQIRNYIWPADVISKIADLEISIYKSFPNLEEIMQNFVKLKTDCSRLINKEDDLELFDAFDNLHDLISSDDSLYCKLNTRMQGAE